MSDLPSRESLRPAALAALQSGAESMPEIQSFAMQQMALPMELEAVTRRVGDRTLKALNYTLRWALQDLRRDGLCDHPKRNGWKITRKGNQFLTFATPTTYVCLYTTPFGKCYWSQAETLSARLESETVKLLFTSPPYPKPRPRDYGNMRVDAWIPWMLGLVEEWRRALAHNGSIMINLGPISQDGNYLPYREELLLHLRDTIGLNLIDELIWHNVCAIPSGNLTTRFKERPKPCTEKIYWLAKTNRPQADIRPLRKPYSTRYQQQLAEGGANGPERPSGHGGTRDNSFTVDNGGALPSNLIACPGVGRDEPYTGLCRAHQEPVHPARFPAALPRFGILMTTEPGELVADPLGGSNITGKVAEELGRRWIYGDQVRNYAFASRHRFTNPQLIQS